MPNNKKKIMSINDLYNFCLKNNFAHFDSSEFGKEVMVRMNGNFSKITKNDEKHKEGLTPFVSRAFHDHVNLNKSEITEESFNENIPSANFRPILANITVNSNGEMDFGSHDYYVDVDNNGNEKVVYEEQPIGVIDGAKTSIEYDEDVGVNRAVLHGYLYDEYCQDAIDILNRRGTVDCSVELSIRAFSFNNENKTLMLDDFYVSGLTLLSQDVKPGMQGSNFKIEDFAVSKDTQKFSIDNKLIETLENLTNVLKGFDINNSLRKEEEIEVEIKENFEEVTETEEVAVTEDTTEEEVTVTENESEETVEETSNEETIDVTEEDTIEMSQITETVEENKPMTKMFEISHDDIRYALYNLLYAFESADNECYYILSVYDDYFVYENWSGNKTFGQKYTVEDDVVAFDGERYILHKLYLTDSEYAEIQEMRSNYSVIAEELNTYKSAELFADKMSVFEDCAYTEYLDTDEFKALMSEESINKYSKEELTEKADATLGKLVKRNKTFEYAETPEEKKSSKIMFSMKKDNVKSKAYGTLFK